MICKYLLWITFLNEPELFLYKDKMLSSTAI